MGVMETHMQLLRFLDNHSLDNENLHRHQPSKSNNSTNVYNKTLPVY